ncbi:MAG: hypothetical protein ABIJ26_06640 [Candidatus Margulisiibacteriota bacterium]|nr:hypothetical protein [Candidatus Margulisiibacteriota bacterium]
MRKLFISTLLGFGILVFGISAGAVAYLPAPCLTGASGLTRVPSATVLPYKNWNLATDYGMTWDKAQTPQLYYKANLGTFHSFEMGLVGGLDGTGEELREGVFINMKYSPTLGDGSDPLLLAIGVENLASKTQTGLYMVATKPFKQGFDLSFGFLADFPAGKFRPLGLAGLEIPVGQLSFLTDLFAGENVFQLNAGLRYHLISAFAFDIRGINILADENSNASTSKDPKSILAGFSWINPF